MTTAESTLSTYTVRLDCGPDRLTGELDVPTSLGAVAAARRAVMAAVWNGWGELENIRVISSKPADDDTGSATDTFAPDRPALLVELPRRTAPIATAKPYSVQLIDEPPKGCPLCGAPAVIPLTPAQRAEQPDNTTHVCHPALGGCNHGFGPS